MDTVIRRRDEVVETRYEGSSCKEEQPAEGERPPDP
jgi:hypothetical protein